MRRSTIIRAIVSVVLVGCLAAAAHLLWTTPLAGIPSQAPIGKLNLDEPGASLCVTFFPPKRLSSITLFFPKHMQGSGEHCAHPDFPLSVRVSVAEIGSANIIDELITNDRMQWTSWHDGPSLLLIRLSEHVDMDSEYEMRLEVNSAVDDLGQVDVFLHWMDGAYLWGLEEQELKLTSRRTQPATR